MKKLIYNSLINSIISKIESIESYIVSTKESRDNNTKSSAGDKHETARAMMQIELDNNQKQLQQYLALKEDLNKINLDRTYTSIEFGSLVITDKGNYFISIGIGKIEIDNEPVFAISLASPIGQQMKGKQKGDFVTFNGNQLQIIDIV
jgi:transcription elongation GreA/GreB family factor